MKKDIPLSSTQPEIPTETPKKRIGRPPKQLVPEPEPEDEEIEEEDEEKEELFFQQEIEKLSARIELIEGLPASVDKNALILSQLQDKVMQIEQGIKQTEEAVQELQQLIQIVLSKIK